MADVVKEVASRFIFLSGKGGNCYFSGNPQVGIPLGCLTRRLFKVKVSIRGGEGDTFEMAGEDQLKELSSVAQAVGAKLTIKEVQTFRTLAPWHMSMETFELIAALVGEQEEEVQKVALMAVEVWNSCALPQMEVFVSLVKASKEWTVQSMTIGLLGSEHCLSNEEIWRTLAKKAGCGKIGKLVLLVNTEEVATVNEEDVKEVWEISERVEVEFYTMSNEELVLSSRCAGGRGADPKTTWEEVYQDVLKKIWKI